MAYWWNIHVPVRYAYKEGMSGADVAAFQLNLGGVPVDGDFGELTVARVKEYQRTENLFPDGIAGLKTNQRLCVQAFYDPTEKYDLPKGLLKSFASSESNFMCGACSPHPNDAGWDVGALQISSGSIGNPGQSYYELAYDTEAAAERTGKLAREEFGEQPSPVPSRYLDELAGGNKPLFKWQMVALNHNWPVAAHYIPRRGHIYSDPARDDQHAQWISDVTNGRLTTPRQWVEFQVQTKTVYLEI
jgi:hypothetical protein